MKGCDHDVVYSGQTNLEQRFAYICRKCGETGWDSRYVLARVDIDEFCRQRVIHGWASPNPRVPVVVPPAERRFYRNACLFFAGLFVLLGVLGPSTMPLWAMLTGMGVALLNATLLFLCWKGQWSNPGHRGSP